jgi:hypothetical protein
MLCFREIGQIISITHQDRDGQVLILTTPSIVTATLWTTDKMVQLVSDSKTRDESGRFKVIVRELDPVKFWTARRLPHEYRPAPGEENAALKVPPIIDGVVTEALLKQTVEKEFTSLFS